MTYRNNLLRALHVALLITSLSSSLFAQNSPAFKVLAQFAGSDGANPVSQPIQLPNGNLLGVTLSSKAHPHSPSTIYQITNTGAIQTVYKLASNGSQGFVIDNDFTNNGMVQASDGNVYGIMDYATGGGYGLIYRFTFPNTFQILHRFSTSSTDCFAPDVAMVQALDGNLYGTCTEGGTNAQGALLRVGLDGSYALLYSFSSLDTVGGDPVGGLVAHPNGLLYGITTFSYLVGAPGNGSLYQFDPVLGQVSVLSGSGYSPSSQIVVERDLSLTVTENDGSTPLLVRYALDGTGPQTLYNFSTSGIPQPGGALSEPEAGVYVGGPYPYYQINVAAQSATDISVPPHQGSGPEGYLAQTAGGGLVAAWPSTLVSPYFGELIQYTGSFPRPAPFLLGFYPQTVAAGQTVTVLGNYFVGTSSVTVGGQSVSYTVKASGAIQFTAPTGPESGVITVVNGGGSTSSAQPLTVE